MISLKKLIIENITETPEFKRWFGNSKVVDSYGNPLIVYHGTNKNFRKFSLKKAAQGIIWVTSNKSEIEGGNIGAQGKGKIMELYAKIENPAGWKAYDKYSIYELIRDGYDGVILPTDNHFNAIVFKPNQIKSATKNNGQFNPATDDITKESLNAPPAHIQKHVDHKFSTDFINFMKKLENENLEGYNKEKKLWYPHKSVEGGKETIGYGHKLGNDLGHYEKGITDKVATDLLIYDLKLANMIVHMYIKKKYKVSLQLTEKQEEMLTEFAFNLGDLNKFPKFTDAVLRNNWDVVKQEYERGYKSNGKIVKIDGRNKYFYDRFLK